ncbi:HD domain-containing protein [Candidatus Peregrinibacteria bacterium]|nr:HD domain-containing protein [Candidatus Peregrinibacteria bacterium]
MNKEKIQQIYKKFHVPKHIIKHMKKVAEVCRALSDAFEKKGVNIDKNKLIQAALLHDVLRMCDFKDLDPKNIPQKVSDEDIEVWKGLRNKYGKKGHTSAMSEILEKMGERKIADLINKHDFFSVNELKTWEEKILFYSDKRVSGAKIVTLKERFREGKKRNMRKKDSLKKVKNTENKIIQLEKEIINVLGKLPDKLSQ